VKKPFRFLRPSRRASELFVIGFRKKSLNLDADSLTLRRLPIILNHSSILKTRNLTSSVARLARGHGESSASLGACFVK
jgi:hypothetical protein